MKSDKPLVSVIIPYYKNLKYFKNTYKSIINQNYKNLEIIIIYDDKDRSELKEIKKAIKKKTKLLINPQNLGAGYSRNRGIKNSKGKYIAFIDSDDIWHKNKLKIQINYMEKNNINFSHCSYNIIDKDGFKLGARKARKNLEFNRLLRSCDIGLSTVIIKKKILKKLKFPNLKTKEDFVMWLQIARNYEVIGLSQILASWRKTRDSLSSNTFQKFKDGFNVYNKYMKFNFIKSTLFLFILSFNYLFKNLKSKY